MLKLMSRDVRLTYRAIGIVVLDFPDGHISLCADDVVCVDGPTEFHQPVFDQSDRMRAMHAMESFVDSLVNRVESFVLWLITLPDLVGEEAG